MGLDVTSYETVTLVRATDSPTTEERDAGLVYLYPVPAFVAATDSMREGVYSHAGTVLGFSAGAYSTYMEFRRALARMAGIADLEGFWRDPRPGPFTELLNNADNEGFIGPKTSAKLAEDFATHRETAARDLEPWAFGLYVQWQAAFELAAHEGVVELH